MLVRSLIVTLVLTALFAFFYFDHFLFENGIEGDGTTLFNTYTEAFSIIGTLVNIAYIVLGATLISRLIISEFRNKTIYLMFTYPVSRRKIIAAKLIIVAAWIFIGSMVSGGLIGGLMLISEMYVKVIPEPLSAAIIIRGFSMLIAGSVCSAGIGMIPLYFGMRKHSATATILSAVIVACLLNQNTHGFSLNQFIVIPLLTAIAGIIVVIITIRNINTVDIN